VQCLIAGKESVRFASSGTSRARRIAVLVIVESEDRNEPQSIVLLRPPADP
jgi:hypothetical protein